jgi:dipeptidyl aminopeptidase/acylaminoacyl peptidase
MTREGESFRIVQKALGDRYPEGVAAFSPLNFVKRTYVPTYFIHGAHDPWVPVSHTDVAAKKLRALGIAHMVDVQAKMGHGLQPEAQPTHHQALLAMARWLRGQVE